MALSLLNFSVVADNKEVAHTADGVIQLRRCGGATLPSRSNLLPKCRAARATHWSNVTDTDAAVNTTLDNEFDDDGDDDGDDAVVSCSAYSSIAAAVSPTSGPCRRNVSTMDDTHPKNDGADRIRRGHCPFFPSSEISKGCVTEIVLTDDCWFVVPAHSFWSL